MPCNDSLLQRDTIVAKVNDPLLPHGAPYCCHASWHIVAMVHDAFFAEVMCPLLQWFITLSWCMTHCYNSIYFHCSWPIVATLFTLLLPWYMMHCCWRDVSHCHHVIHHCCATLYQVIHPIVTYNFVVAQYWTDYYWQQCAVSVTMGHIRLQQFGTAWQQCGALHGNNVFFV